MQIDAFIFALIALLASLQNQTYAQTQEQVAAILGGRVGPITEDIRVEDGNAYNTAYDHSALSGIPAHWGATSTAVVVNAVNGGAGRGRTGLNNRTGYITRLNFYVINNSMDPGTFVSMAVGKIASNIHYTNSTVAAAYYTQLANVGGELKFQVKYPTVSGEVTDTWSGTVALNTAYAVYIEHNIVAGRLLVKVNEETVTNFTLDAVSAQSIGTLVLGSSGGSTGRNIAYLLDYILETAIPQGGRVPTAVSVSSPANGATNVEVAQTLVCTGTEADTWEIRYETVNPPVGAYTSLGAQTFVGPLSLANNTTYYVQCRATNENGSTTSAVSSFTTKAVTSTGTHPTLLITAARETVWAQYKSDYDTSTGSGTTKCNDWTAGTAKKLSCEMYKKALDNVAYTAEQAKNLGNNGFSEAWLAVVPGNDSAFYCGKLWTRWSQPGQFLAWPNTGVFTGVFIMHSMIDFALGYDWCYNDWTQAQRDEALSQFNEMARRAAFGVNQWSDPYQCNDTDQPIGWYFGIAAFYEATKSYNPDIVEIFEMPAAYPTPKGAPGGSTVTTLHCSSGAGKTWRNMIDYYYDEASDGGVWYEGTQYGTGIDSGDMLGPIGSVVLGTTDLAGLYPEVDAWLVEHARWILHGVTPDKKAMAEFGDANNPRGALTYRLGVDYFPWAMGTAGMLADGTERQALMRMILDLYGTHGSAPITSGVTREKHLALFNPYATAAADLTALPQYLNSPGVGVTLWREGFSTNDCHFFTHFLSTVRHWDHRTDYFGDYQLYCNGEWVITHPIGYGDAGSIDATILSGAQYAADFQNAMWIEGLPSFPPSQTNALQSRGTVGFAAGTDYLYHAGAQGGSIWARTPNGWDGLGSWDPPPRFVHEHTRQVLLLSSATKEYASVLELNRINAVDPESLERFARYTGIDTTGTYTSHIQNNPRWTNFFHHRGNPTTASNITTSATTGGQQIRDVWLAPDAVTFTETDLSASGAFGVGGDGSSFPISEATYRINATPNSDAQWNCLSRLVTVRDSSSVTVETVTELSPTNDGGGVLLSRTGNDDRVVTWNCKQGSNITSLYPSTAEVAAIVPVAHFRASGSSTFSYTQTTASAKLFFLDLAPSLSWAYTVDGGASTPITEDSGGFAVVTISGTGAHEIVLTGS